MRDVAELRAFLARILGWSDMHAVELALNSVTLAAAGCTTLVLCGEGDLVPIASALHRRIREPGRPFVVADPRRGDQRASARSPASRKNVVDALGDVRVEARVDATGDARSGTLCFRLRLGRSPTDLAKAVPLLRVAHDVMVILCATPHTAGDRLLIRPAPVVVPPLVSRAHELERIVDEYTADAIAELAAPEASITAADRAWVRNNAAASLAEIEKATLRLVTLRTSRNLSHAAARLEMAPVSLSRWLGRRKLPPAAAPREIERPEVEWHQATLTTAEIWRDNVLAMLEEPQREGLAPEFAFGDANIRDGAKELLARIKSGPVPWDNEAITGLEALLADLEARMTPADPGPDKPNRCGGRR